MIENAGERTSSGSILAADLLDTPSARLQPEKRLMLAVLEAAVGDFQKYATAPSGRGRRLFADAESWFESTATDRPLGFETICDALALDPSFIRDGLHRWCAARREEPQLSRTVLHFPFRRITAPARTISRAS